MKLIDAYNAALDEDSDPLEREEFSSSTEIKTLIIEEIAEAMKKIRHNAANNASPVDLIKPLFDCAAFYFIIGIRVGKILRDAELAER